MEDVVPDILENILLRSDVKDLIRFKSVCKLWRSIISDDNFVKAHMKLSCNNDHNNNNFGVRRIVMSYSSIKKYYIVGSSNGLVCIASFCGQFFVANPSTRQLRILPKPLPGYQSGNGSPVGPIGFGYDSISDDYKVVLGSRCSRFSILSLKTNAWKFTRQLGFTDIYFKIVGALCNGAIHWLMKADNSKYVIRAFDLSKEEFKEIHLPDEEINCCYRLGIIDGCICIYRPTPFYGRPRWVMKSYNVKSSWTLMPPYGDVPHKVNDAIHTLKSLEDDYIPHTSFFTNEDDDKIELRYKEQDLCAPIYVHSLVSPHVHRRLKRMRDQTNNQKLIKGDMRSI